MIYFYGYLNNTTNCCIGFADNDCCKIGYFRLKYNDCLKSNPDPTILFVIFSQRLLLENLMKNVGGISDAEQHLWASILIFTKGATKNI